MYHSDTGIEQCIQQFRARWQEKSARVPGADLAFFQGGGGGFDPTTMRSIVHVHEPRSGEPIFFFYFDVRAA